MYSFIYFQAEEKRVERRGKSGVPEECRSAVHDLRGWGIQTRHFKCNRRRPKVHP